MMLKLKSLFLGLLLISPYYFPLMAQPENTGQITLAVMNFKNNSSIFRYDRLEQALPEMLKTEISRSPEILVVERSKIESILAEQALAQTGIIKGEAAQEVGRLAGAEYIITGEINSVGDQLRIDAHLTKVATGQVIGEKITGKDKENIEPIVKLLANNLIFNLIGKGERKELIKIHRYYSNWGFATTAVVSITSAILHFKYKNNYNKYHETDQLSKFDLYYGDANKYYKARNIMLAISGTFALTTFILWRKDVSEENKIYAYNHESLHKHVKKELWFALAMERGEFLLSLGLRF